MNFTLDLSEKIEPELEGLDYDTKKRILDKLSSISSMAQEQLNEENYFGMSTLLKSRGSRVGDPNWLDQLAAELEGKEDTDEQ